MKKYTVFPDKKMKYYKDVNYLPIAMGLVKISTSF